MDNRDVVWIDIPKGATKLSFTVETAVVEVSEGNPGEISDKGYESHSERKKKNDPTR